MSATRSILKKNPYYKDYEKDPKYVRKFDKWKQELQKTSHTLLEVNVLHQATQRLEEQIRYYYDKIGIAGVMAGLLQVGGSAYMKKIGHFAGQLVGQILLSVSNSSAPVNQRNHFAFRAHLEILSTHTSSWRSALHGITWSYAQGLYGGFDAINPPGAIRVDDATIKAMWSWILSSDSCGEYYDSNPFFFTSCLHGFGHGVHLMTRDARDAPTLGIEVCRAVTRRTIAPPKSREINGESDATSLPHSFDAELSGQCATGVFMEYFDLLHGGYYRSHSVSGLKQPSAIGDEPLKYEHLSAEELRLGFAARKHLCTRFAADRVAARACYFRLFTSTGPPEKRAPRKIDSDVKSGVQRAAPAFYAADFCAPPAATFSSSDSGPHNVSSWAYDDPQQFGMGPPLSATAQFLRADCLYGFAKALYDPHWNLAEFCGPSSSVSSQRGQESSERAGQERVGAHTRGEQDDIRMVVTGSEIRARAACIYGAVSMGARNLEGSAQPSPKASSSELRKAENTCHELWPAANQSARHVAKSVDFSALRGSGSQKPMKESGQLHTEAELNLFFRAACLVGLRSLHSARTMANIAWCETCAAEGSEQQMTALKFADPRMSALLPTASLNHTGLSFVVIPNATFGISSTMRESDTRGFSPSSGFGEEDSLDKGILAALWASLFIGAICLGLFERYSQYCRLALRGRNEPSIEILSPASNRRLDNLKRRGRDVNGNFLRHVSEGSKEFEDIDVDSPAIPNRNLDRSSLLEYEDEDEDVL